MIDDEIIRRQEKSIAETYEPTSSNIHQLRKGQRLHISVSCRAKHDPFDHRVRPVGVKTQDLDKVRAP